MINVARLKEIAAIARDGDASKPKLKTALYELLAERDEFSVKLSILNRDRNLLRAILRRRREQLAQMARDFEASQ